VSTAEQDPKRALYALQQFAEAQKITLSKVFLENESGAKLARPKLFFLIDIAERGDVILVEQIDRLSRLTNDDWKTLRALLDAKGINIVSLDLPTSHIFLQPRFDEFTQNMFSAVNHMMLDMLAAIARKDYEDRRRRQAEGIAKAKIEGKFKGRAKDKEKRSGVRKLLKAGISWNATQKIVGCGRAMVAAVAKELKEENKYCDQQHLFKGNE
jgi:DNA invertase Pin-like site-specific DNA recombinase